MPIALTNAPRSSFWSPNRLRMILGQFGRSWATVTWSLLLEIKFLPFRTPFAWVTLTYVFCCSLASLEMDAQEIKVALPSCHALQKTSSESDRRSEQGLLFFGKT